MLMPINWCKNKSTNQRLAANYDNESQKEALNRLCWKEKIAYFAAFSCTIHKKLTSSLSLFVSTTFVLDM